MPCWSPEAKRIVFSRPLHSLLLISSVALGLLACGRGSSSANGGDNPVPAYVLTVTKSGTGSGTITSSVGAIHCGSACNSSPLRAGTSVTLTATPSVGSTFDGWSGGGVSGTGNCTLVVSGNTAVTAIFTAAAPALPAIYVAQSQMGTGDGSSSANAKAVSFFNTASNWGAGLGLIGPGTTVRLCGTLSTTLAFQGSGAIGNPITLLFESGSKLSKSAWGIDAAAAIYSSGKSHLVIDGGGVGIIENTGNGDGLPSRQSSYGMTITDGSDIEIKNLMVQNIYLHTYNTDNAVASYSTRGIYVSNCSDLYIHDNTINHAYVGIYDLANGVAVTKHRITHNTLSATSTAIIPALGGSNSDAMDQVSVTGNDITMGLNWFDTPNNNHIDGIHIWTSGGRITNLSVNGNTIHGDPSTHCTGLIFLEGNFTSPLICNNVLTATTNHPMGGYINLGGSAGTDAFNLFNNTIVGLGATNAGGIGINLFAPSGTVIAARIKNNLFASVYIGLYDSDSPNPDAAFTFESDYNVFYNVGSVGWRVTHDSTLSSWQAHTGGDAHSLTSNPLLNGSFTLPSNSPAVDAGVSLASFFSTDKDGTSRPQGTAWDIGAYEYH